MGAAAVFHGPRKFAGYEADGSPVAAPTAPETTGSKRADTAR